ncbi:MAG: tetratricopeptide repeat protein [Lachnospiraceae bacterium]|nr:tetratricopeptide repeat protein [Lachnospiraceae bacterium]
MRKHINFKIITLASLLLLGTLTSSFAGCDTKDNSNNTQGLSYYKKGQYHSAITAFEAAIATNNKEPDFYVNLGMTYVELADYESARTQFELALELDKSHRLAKRGMGIVDLALGDYESAIDNFSDALLAANGILTTLELDLLDYRSLAEFKNGDYEAAITGYTTLIDVDYRKCDHYYLRGQVYLLDDQYDNAIADFNNAISLANGDCTVYLNIYHALVASGYETEARNYLGKALSDNAIGDDYSLGLIYFYLDDYTNALLKLVSASLNNNDALVYLAKAYYASGDIAQAKATYKKYLNYDNTNGYVYNHMGIISMDEGDYAGALSYFQTGILTKDTKCLRELMWNEIVCYERLGDFETALAKITDYIASYPDDDIAKREYEFLKTR